MIPVVDVECFRQQGKRQKNQVATLACSFLYFLIFSSGPPNAGDKTVDNTLTGQ